MFHQHPLCFRQKPSHFRSPSASFILVTMAAGGGGLEQLMTAQMVQAAKVVEERLDEEMDRLDNMNDEELDKVRTSTRQMSRFHF